jgi:hypothetical protein
LSIQQIVTVTVTVGAPELTPVASITPSLSAAPPSTDVTVYVTLPAQAPSSVVPVASAEPTVYVTIPPQATNLIPDPPIISAPPAQALEGAGLSPYEQGTVRCNTNLQSPSSSDCSTALDQVKVTQFGNQCIYPNTPSKYSSILAKVRSCQVLSWSYYGNPLCITEDQITAMRSNLATCGKMEGGILGLMEGSYFQDNKGFQFSHSR